MKDVVVKSPDMCLVRDDFLGHTRYSLTWCGLKFQAYTNIIHCTKHIDDTTCEECRDQYALTLLGELP